MITCTRKIAFDAAHRLIDHESKCRFVHGHRYVAEVTFSSKELDTIGRVVDFGLIKERLGSWIDKHWDHTLVLNQADIELGNSISAATGQTIHYIPCNPTAENMADYLFNEVCPALFADTDIVCQHVRLHETPNCYADVDNL